MRIVYFHLIYAKSYAKRDRIEPRPENQQTTHPLPSIFVVHKLLQHLYLQHVVKTNRTNFSHTLLNTPQTNQKQTTNHERTDTIPLLATYSTQNGTIESITQTVGSKHTKQKKIETRTRNCCRGTVKKHRPPTIVENNCRRGVPHKAKPTMLRVLA